MLDTVKPVETTVLIVPAGTFRCTSVDPEEADAQDLRTGFGATDNYVFERSSEYTVGV